MRLEDLQKQLSSDNQEFKKYSKQKNIALDLGRMIKQVRRMKDYTQMQLAKKMGLEYQSQIARVESGKHEPKISFLLSIADALEEELLLPRFTFMKDIPAYEKYGQRFSSDVLNTPVIFSSSTCSSQEDDHLAQNLFFRMNQPYAKK